MERRPEKMNTGDLFSYENQPSVAPVAAPAGKTSPVYAIIIAILAIAAIALAVVLFTVSKSKREIINELEMEKADLVAQIDTLQMNYDTLSTNNAKLNLELEASREEVALLVERIQKADATNRAQIRKYQRELGTLRDIMRNYVKQIDSLNTLNHKLTVQAAEAKKETATVKKENEYLQQTVSELTDKVEIASTISGRDVKVEAFDAKGKKTDMSKRISYVTTTVTLAENPLAPKGIVRVYVIVKNPEGVILTNADSIMSNYGGQPMQTSASREIDFQGREVTATIFLNDIENYPKGVYTVQVFTDSVLLGTASFPVR